MLSHTAHYMDIWECGPQDAAHIDPGKPGIEESVNCLRQEQGRRLTGWTCFNTL